MTKLLAALTLALALAGCSGGQTVGLTVEDALYRAPLAAGAPGVAYFSITSNVADRIVAVSSPAAKAVEIHESATGEGGMAGMKMTPSVALPAGKTVKFAPGGLHLMVIEPHPLAANATFPIQITLESGRTETISFGDATTGG